MLTAGRITHLLFSFAESISPKSRAQRRRCRKEYPANRLNDFRIGRVVLILVPQTLDVYCQRIVVYIGGNEEKPCRALKTTGSCWMPGVREARSCRGYISDGKNV